MRLLNLRVDENLRTLITLAVCASGRTSMSEWARDALEAGARRELAEQERVTPSPQQALGMFGNVLIHPSGCQHPPQAQYTGVTAVTCLLCGAEVRRTL